MESKAGTLLLNPLDLRCTNKANLLHDLVTLEFEGRQSLLLFAPSSCRFLFLSPLYYQPLLLLTLPLLFEYLLSPRFLLPPTLFRSPLLLLTLPLGFKFSFLLSLPPKSRLGFLMLPLFLLLLLADCSLLCPSLSP